MRSKKTNQILWRDNCVALPFELSGTGLHGSWKSVWPHPLFCEAPTTPLTTKNTTTINQPRHAESGVVEFAHRTSLETPSPACPVTARQPPPEASPLEWDPPAIVGEPP